MMTYKKLHEEKYIEAYSIQQQHAFDCLRQGSIYMPKLKNSHGKKCQNHKCAYKMMAAQFNKRMKKYIKPKDAFFWISFDKKALLCGENFNQENNKIKKWLVTLKIPTSEILISLYSEWREFLQGNVWDNGKWICPLYIDDAELEFKKKESLERIFNIPNGCLLVNLQGVIERVEPDWIKGEMIELVNEL